MVKVAACSTRNRISEARRSKARSIERAFERRASAALLGFWAVTAWFVLGACTDTGKISADLARGHAEFLLKEADKDVDQVRTGLPKGAKVLSKILDMHPG